MYFGVEASSLPHVIFSFGTAPEYEPYDVVESEIWQKYPQTGIPVRCRSWCSIGTTQIGKSPAIPPPIWKNPIECSALVRVYQSASAIMYSMPVRTVCTFLTWPSMQWPEYMLPRVESSQPGTNIGRFRSAAAIIQLSFGSIW